MNVTFASSLSASNAQALRQTFVYVFHQPVDISCTPAGPAVSKKPKAWVCVTASIVEIAGVRGFSMLRVNSDVEKKVSFLSQRDKTAAGCPVKENKFKRSGADLFQNTWADPWGLNHRVQGVQQSCHGTQVSVKPAGCRELPGDGSESQQNPACKCRDSCRFPSNSFCRKMIVHLHQMFNQKVYWCFIPVLTWHIWSPFIIYLISSCSL